MPKHAMSDVVIVLPGITGSVLRNRDGDVVWGYSAGSIVKALFTGGGSMARSLALAGDDPALDDIGDGITASALMPDLHIIPGLWKIDGYTALTDMLLANFELEEGVNFFRFPYDWRRDNRVAARKLARDAHGWLKRRRESGHADARLILLAHSMGGLVSRYFLECMEGWKDTRALITFGTPYRGSMNSVDSLANGMKKGPVDLTDAVRQFTSVYQLLPVFKCWDDGSGVLQRVGEVKGIPHIDAERAAAALAFHREIEAAVATNHALPAFAAGGYQTHPIVGISQQTQLSARALGAGAELSELSGDDKRLGGDGTVPRVSAIPIEMSNNPLGTVYAATQHGSLQNADAVLAHLQGLLSGFNLDLGGFLRPKVQVALELDDVIDAGAPLVVRVRPVRADVALEVVLHDAAGFELGRKVPKPAADGWLSAEFAPPAQPGIHRVSAVGEAIEPAQDSCVVLDATVSP